MTVYPNFPSAEDWHNIIADSQNIKNLAFFACSAEENNAFLDSIGHFNDKLEKLRISYYFVRYYYQTPDAGDMFEYFVENFYIRLFSLWDFVYHLINEFYNFLIDSDQGRGFKGDVIRQLNKTDRTLGERLRVIERENTDFRQAREYRNSIVHQVFPGDPSIELVRSKWSGKIRTEVRPAVAPQEFMNNITSVITLIVKTLDMLQREFDDDKCDIFKR